MALTPASISGGSLSMPASAFHELSFQTEGREFGSLSLQPFFDREAWGKPVTAFAVVEFVSLRNLLHAVRNSVRNFSSAWYPKQGVVLCGISCAARS
jgi:hypothetical protein